MDVTGAGAVGIGRRRDTDQLCTGPAEQHRQRGRIVGVTREIGVQMEPHPQRLACPIAAGSETPVAVLYSRLEATYRANCSHSDAGANGMIGR